MNTQVASAADYITLRPPERSDGAALHDLIASCPPLDLNSRYAYLLLCEHHAATCVVAEAEGQLVGAITAYIPPAKPDTLFIWQVAVAPDMQGHQIASRMLDQLIAHCAASYRFQKIETTISPSNIGSRKLFESYARRHRVDIQAQPYLSASEFGAGQHEEEWLYQLGPGLRAA